MSEVALSPIATTYLRTKVLTFVKSDFHSISVFSDGHELVSMTASVTQETPFSVTATIELAADDYIGSVIERVVLKNSDGVDLMEKKLATPKAKGSDPVEVSLKMEF